MKFQCSSCALRMDSFHFKQEGLINPKLTSICDICLQRGLNAEDYANNVVEVFAKTLLYTFVGKTDVEGEECNFIVNNQKLRKRYESFLQDYDGNELATAQIPRHDFNQAIIRSEDGEIDFVPDQSREFKYNLEQMGMQVNFDLNEVDYIDRERIRAKYHYRCQYCGRRGTSVDHKDPVSISHNNDLDNLILSCAECNRIKSNMPFDLFEKLNNQISAINKKLVKYENSLGTLREEFEKRRREIAAKMHLKGVVNDPELNTLRSQNKKLQDGIDSLQSDYDALRKMRETHFSNGWKIACENRKTDIV
ncbi:HNH endonuclease [Lactobacillus agrestimuris]|uniref:HNH endonuclease n=1 Tax=Lactobacillus agrestimuris TaxID=2941328 RepID=UPI0020448E53|nr:HNH endonuclease signature motif containing protein [Lactobacillus agrestimuris]